ncbi:class I SAM-dependent DNA methyltransferase [Saccharopolyspora flava]|uniref:class I SAM-dependent DNA methyltransferase n=1 Tax=Saccharopolyspora flava TaxID=95161 RepID=UPI0011149995|nr:class I SAM-dependent methyltransferase [Saccharopolyspora flava]
MTDYARTAASYDLIAADYADHALHEVDSKPLDRSMLTAFAELVSGRVADVGCGTGNGTAVLHRLGVDVFGIDLSAEMLAHARRQLPDVHFTQGSMTDLNTADASLGGIVAWYSIIHTAPEDLPAVFAEFRRALAPGGLILLAFQTGADTLHLTEAYDRAIDLTFLRHTPEDVADRLTDAGLTPHATLVRQPEGERSPHAFLLARG